MQMSVHLEAERMAQTGRHSAAIPLHRRLEASFRRAIAAGDWPPGERIPPEMDLAKLHGASRHTVRQALSALVRDGVIVRRAGDGSYVRQVPTAEILAPWFSLTAELERRGVRARTRLLEHELYSDGAIAWHLQVADEAPLHRITRRHDYRSHPIAVEVVHLPVDLVGELVDGQLEGSLHGLLGARGLRPVRARIDISTASLEEIPEGLRGQLDASGIPLARFERLSFLADGTPLEHIVFWYPHDIEEWLLGRDAEKRG